MALSKALAAQFEAFWAAYPRRPDNPKAAARLVFERRVREGADPAAIVAAAGRYAGQVAARKLDAMFVPHARTWLSQRRWEDYLEEDVPAPVGEVDQPGPEHPLAWLKAEMSPETWASWIEPLQFFPVSQIIHARTRLALERVRRDWGDLIDAHYDRQTAWAVKRKDSP